MPAGRTEGPVYGGCWALGAASLLLVAASGLGWGAVLPAEIAADTHLTQGNSPYEMRSNVLVVAGANLTVESGVTIIATGDYRLTISGSLQALAPPGSHIIFRAADTHASGAWGGLYFTSGAVGRLRHCIIRSAQDNILVDSADVRLYTCNIRLASRDGVMAWGESFLKAVHCTFQNNGRYGAHVQTSRPTGVISFSDFVGNGEHPVLVKATCVEMLHGGNTYEHNGINTIGVDCGSLTDIEDIDCWRNQGIPYDLSVASPTTELVIEQGALLKVKAGIRLYPPHRIVVRGTLIFEGSADRRVVVAPAGTSQSGDWLGIELEPGAVARIISTIIAHAENALVLDAARMYMRDGVIRHCEYDGIYAAGASRVQAVYSMINNCGRSAIRLPDSASGGNIHDCAITGCGDYPVFAMATNAEALRGGNTYSGNAKQAIGVACSQNPDIHDDDPWLAQGVPFDLTARPEATYIRIAPGARLTLRAGVQVIGGGIGAEGIFVAAGEPGNPVTFGSASDTSTPGDWTGIEYLPGSAGRLVCARVNHAETGVTIASDGHICLSDCIFRFCERDGIRLTNGAVPLITGCYIHHNGRHGVSLTNNAQPLLGVSGDPSNPGQNSLFLNGGYDLCNATAHDLRAEANWWGTTDPEEICAHTWDQEDDASLGKVDFQPFLEGVPSASAAVRVDCAVRPQPGLTITSLSAAPTSAGAAIHVCLSRPAELRVIVRNIAGRPIRNLEREAREPAQVIIWDGRSNLGTKAPLGQYLVEVQALANDGSTARALAPLLLQGH